MISDANLLFAWVWILAGFVSGMLMGIRFHDETWLGGYASFKRRMYRLGHISFFGLGTLNLLYHFSVTGLNRGTLSTIASISFLLGGVTMPICCWLMAENKKFQSLFAVPVISLITGATVTIVMVVL